MTKLRHTLAAVAAATVPALAHAQATPYYILNGDGETAYVVQNGALQSTFAIPFTDGMAMYAPVWNGSALLVANRSGSAAVEYSAAGTPTGTTYSNTGDFDQLLDGATDGTHTYAVRCCSQADGVYVGDAHFGGMTQISTLGRAGIAYASSTGHLFVTDFGNTLSELTTSGTLLNQWTVASGLSALAYEASTNTLWGAVNGSSNIYQYSLAGAELQHLSVAGLGGNFYGGEMAGAVTTTTPEPASVALLGAGLLALGGVVRRRRSASEG